MPHEALGLPSRNPAAKGLATDRAQLSLADLVGLVAELIGLRGRLRVEQAQHGQVARAGRRRGCRRNCHRREADVDLGGVTDE